MVVTGVDPRSIAAPYRGILDEVVRGLQPLIGAGVHSIYLYGSVATGQARPPTSDVDLLVVTTTANRDKVERVVKPIETRHRRHVRELAAGCQGLDAIQAVSEAGAVERCFLRHYCLHLAGPDLRAGLPECRADATLAHGFNGDLEGVVARLGSGPDPEDGDGQQRHLIAYTARRLLMAGATLLSVRHGTWSTDRETGAALLVAADPRLAGDARALLAWTTLETTTATAPSLDEATRVARRVLAHLRGGDGAG